MARTIDTGDSHKFIHKKPNMYLNNFSITVDGDTATCKTKFDKENQEVNQLLKAEIEKKVDLSC